MLEFFSYAAFHADVFTALYPDNIALYGAVIGFSFCVFFSLLGVYYRNISYGIVKRQLLETNVVSDANVWAGWIWLLKFISHLRKGLGPGPNLAILFIGDGNFFGRNYCKRQRHLSSLLACCVVDCVNSYRIYSLTFGDSDLGIRLTLRYTHLPEKIRNI